MRVIKAMLVGAVGLFVIMTLFSLLIPSKVRVSRAVLISNTTAGKIYNEVATINNWKNWHPIFTTDSARLQPTNPPSKEAHILQRGKDVKLTFLSVDSTAVKFSLQSASDNDIDNEIAIIPIPAQQAVQVEWRAITKLHWYPWDKFYGIFIDKLSGPGYEAALNGLKNYLETHR